ncbi:hypothetical protein N7516_004269 [Penicillium verrucosum]|uniref:uncharacterized protein n=1 Tax=Penicillium verrucosum TaxID=60171 RepID=UPI0025457EAB|nr:uncharacterized protein N7516_004269 [Penicillium verrucosum]KAJ5944101.1 hypothetical protein N7516_004269 [Penicillium verrucosum]
MRAAEKSRYRGLLPVQRELQMETRNRHRLLRTERSGIGHGEARVLGAIDASQRQALLLNLNDRLRRIRTYTIQRQALTVELASV